MEKQQRTRRWVFTENNPQQSAQAAVERLTREYAVRYLVVGEEVGQQEHTPHLQGFVEFEHAATFTQVRERLPRAHIEPALGSNRQNRMYCTKGSTFVEVGTLSQRAQGAEESADVVTLVVVDGFHPSAIAVQHPKYAPYVVNHFVALAKMWEQRHLAQRQLDNEMEDEAEGEEESEE